MMRLLQRQWVSFADGHNRIMPLYTNNSLARLAPLAPFELLLHATFICRSEALRAKLEQDRRERRKKLGLPEELTEEEKAREAEKARKKAEEEAAKHYVYVKPISGEQGRALRLAGWEEWQQRGQI